MTTRNRTLISTLLGCTIAGLGFASTVYSLADTPEQDTFGSISVMLNWHIVYLCAWIFPAWKFPLFSLQVFWILFIGILPAIEWAVIVFFVMTLWSRLRKGSFHRK